MRRSLALILSAALASAGLSSAATAAPATSPPQILQAPPDQKVARGLIVKAETTSRGRRASIARTADAALPRSVDATETIAGLDGVSLIKFDAPVTAATAEVAADSVEARSDVEWVVPNYYAQIAGEPPVSTNDPYFPHQRNLWDSTSTTAAGGYSVKAPSLWRATTGSRRVVVAVLDTGLVPGHPDLAGQTVAGYDVVDDECTESGTSCVNDGTFISAGDGDGLDGDPSDPGDWVDETYAQACGIDRLRDSSWHGTHVAGIIAGKANNRYGISGVAPGVKVQPVRVIGHCGASMWDIMVAILWASGHDLDVVLKDPYYAGVPVNRTPATIANLSLGVLLSPTDRDNLCELFGGVASLALDRGMSLVAAAGNDSRTTIADANLNVPSSCSGFLAVGATSSTGHRAWYSNSGSSVTVSAPGGDSLVAAGDPAVADRTDTILSTLIDATRGPNARYTIGGYEGTSMAAPLVAGGAALMASLGLTRPSQLYPAVRAAVSAFPADDPAYRSRTVAVGGQSVSTADLNCSGGCGYGILDLATVTAPLGGPRIAPGRRVPGRVLTASSRGLTTPGTSTLSWWRGGTRVSSTGGHRLTAADLGRTLTVRDTVSSGRFTGAFQSTTVAIPKAKAVATFSMPAKVKRTKRAKLKARIRSPYANATGTVRVYDGKRTIATRTLKADHRGRLTITLPRLRKGKHRIRVVYAGSTQFTAATSKAKRVTSR